jgi:hypothetical protein
VLELSVQKWKRCWLALGPREGTEQTLRYLMRLSPIRIQSGQETGRSDSCPAPQQLQQQQSLSS